MNSLEKNLRHLIAIYGGQDTNVDVAVGDILDVLKQGNYAAVDRRPYRDRDGKQFTQYTLQYVDGSGEFVRVPEASNE